jgi:hypothetical protein
MKPAAPVTTTLVTRISDRCISFVSIQRRLKSAETGRTGQLGASVKSEYIYQFD